MHGRLGAAVEVGERRDRRRLDGAAHEDRVAVGDEVREMRHGLGHRSGCGSVQHEPHGALVGVRGDEHDGAPEVRVEQRRRGDEQLALQRVVHACSSMIAPEVLVDARNVLRSRWPNVPEPELVERCRRWAAAAGVDATIVFDGRAPKNASDVVGTGSESADDWIARRAAELREADRPFWLVTSDRGLRARADGAERVIGGGAFLAELGLA